MNSQQHRTKKCPGCHLWLSYSEFYAHPTTRDRLSHKCKACQAKYHLEVSHIRRDRQLQLNFGITLKQYEQMYQDQNGVCAICKQPETSLDSRSKGIRRLAVDHDHKTGDVRKLLCHACNTALGQMDEDPERIKALLAYAEWCQAREPDGKIVQFSLFERRGISNDQS